MGCVYFSIDIFPYYSTFIFMVGVFVFFPMLGKWFIVLIYILIPLLWSGGPLTPGRLSTPRPMAPPTLVRPVRRGNSRIAPQTKCATSWDCDYSSHRKHFWQRLC